MDFPGVLGGVPGASWARLHAAWDDFAPSRGAEMATEVFKHLLQSSTHIPSNSCFDISRCIFSIGVGRLVFKAGTPVAVRPDLMTCM